MVPIFLFLYSFPPSCSPLVWLRLQEGASVKKENSKNVTWVVGARHETQPNTARTQLHEHPNTNKPRTRNNTVKTTRIGTNTETNQPRMWATHREHIESATNLSFPFSYHDANFVLLCFFSLYFPFFCLLPLPRG